MSFLGKTSFRGAVGAGTPCDRTHNHMDFNMASSPSEPMTADAFPSVTDSPPARKIKILVEGVDGEKTVMLVQPGDNLNNALKVEEGQHLLYFDKDFEEFVTYREDTCVSHLDKLKIEEFHHPAHPCSSQTADDKISTSASASEATSGKRSLQDKLSNLFQKNKKRKAPPAKRNHGGSTSTMIRIQFGWMHRNRVAESHAGVRSIKGGGTRYLNVSTESSYSQLCEKGLEAFFPSGNSIQGPRSSFQLDGLGIFHQLLDEDKFNLPEIVNAHGNPSKLFY